MSDQPGTRRTLVAIRLFIVVSLMLLFGSQGSAVAGTQSSIDNSPSSGLLGTTPTMIAPELSSTTDAKPAALPNPIDFNADGYSDIFWRNVVSGENFVLAMYGNYVAAGGSAPPVPDLNWNVAGISDFNGDGYADIFWRHSVQGWNYIWFMGGSTVLGGGSLPTVSNTNWRVVSTDDFTGDNRGDVFWRNVVTGENWMWGMAGLSIPLSTPVASVPNTNWHVVGAGDVNRDNRSDIYWRNVVTGDNYMWAMNGPFVIADGPLPSVPNTNWNIVGSDDYNGDGWDDVLWRNVVTGDNYMWLLAGSTVIADGPLPSVPNTNWMIVQTSDHNADGRNDILWRNRVTGDIYMWFLYATTVYGAPVGYVHPNWRVVGNGTYNGGTVLVSTGENPDAPGPGVADTIHLLSKEAPTASLESNSVAPVTGKSTVFAVPELAATGTTAPESEPQQHANPPVAPEAVRTLVYLPVVR